MYTTRIQANSVGQNPTLTVQSQHKFISIVGPTWES